MTANARRRGRLSMRRFSTKMRRAGWCTHLVFLPRTVSDALHARAQELNTTVRMILVTAVHLGLQRLRPSDVSAMEHRWRGFFQMPAAEQVKRGLMKSERDQKTGRWIGLTPQGGLR